MILGNDSTILRRRLFSLICFVIGQTYMTRMRRGENARYRTARLHLAATSDSLMKKGSVRDSAENGIDNASGVVEGHIEESDGQGIKS